MRENNMAATQEGDRRLRGICVLCWVPAFALLLPLGAIQVRLLALQNIQSSTKTPTSAPCCVRHWHYTNDIFRSIQPGPRLRQSEIPLAQYYPGRFHRSLPLWRHRPTLCGNPESVGSALVG